MSLDPQYGDILKTRLQKQGSLPIMNALGDVIGSNGTFLEKINSDGSVIEPVIHFNPPLAPAYR